MQVVEVTQALPGVEMLGRQSMQTPEEVAAMLRLARAGTSVKRIAVQLGCSCRHLGPRANRHCPTGRETPHACNGL